MYYCAFMGNFGEFACNPRTLSSTHLNHMVSLEGIVTKCSLVRPKVVQSVHWNANKESFHARKYHDQTMTASGAASTSVYPQEDEHGNPVCLRSALKGPRLTPIAHNRIRILNIPRPPDRIDTGNARKSACRTTSSRSRCNHG